MNQNTGRWLHGLIAALVIGLASAIDSGLALIIVDPQSFNLTDKLAKTLITIAVLGALSGLKGAFAYLKTAPEPGWDGQDRRDPPATPPAA